MGADFLVTTVLPEPAMSMLAEAGSVFVPEGVLDGSGLAAPCASGEYNVVVTQLRDVFDADLLAGPAFGACRTSPSGYNNIDVAAATRHGIMIGNTPGVLTDSTADIAMLLILGMARRWWRPTGSCGPGGSHGWEPDLLLGCDVSGAVAGPRRVRAGSPAPRRGGPRFRHGGGVLAAATGRPHRQRGGTRRVRGQVGQVPWRNSWASDFLPCTSR